MKPWAQMFLLALISAESVAAPTEVNCETLASELNQWIGQGRGLAASYMSNSLLTRLPQNRLYGYSGYFEGTCHNQGGTLECQGEVLNSHAREGEVFDQAFAKSAKIRLEQSGRILLQKDSNFVAPTHQECFSNAQGKFVRSSYADALESRIVTFIFRKT